MREFPLIGSNDMRYFITGATGFIGSHLARKLVGDGHEVTALVRDVEKARDLEDLGIDLVKGDITDKRSMEKAMNGADGVFHVAGRYNIGDTNPSAAEAINVQGTMNVLELMDELNIPKGVYTSTVAVNSDTKGELVDEDHRFKGKHISQYDRTKWKAHYQIALPMIQNRGIPLVIVQPGVVYGPGDTSSMGRIFDSYLTGKLPALPGGAEFCWSHIDDIVKGHILAMEGGKPGESYFLTGARHSVVEAMGIAEGITNIKPPRFTLSPGLIKAMAGLTSVLERFLPIPEFYRSETLRATAGTTYIASNEKAKRELGYEPISLKEGFSKYLPMRMKELGATGKE